MSLSLTQKITVEKLLFYQEVWLHIGSMSGCWVTYFLQDPIMLPSYFHLLWPKFIHGVYCAQWGTHNGGGSLQETALVHQCPQATPLRNGEKNLWISIHNFHKWKSNNFFFFFFFFFKNDQLLNVHKYNPGHLKFQHFVPKCVTSNICSKLCCCSRILFTRWNLLKIYHLVVWCQTVLTILTLA